MFCYATIEAGRRQSFAKPISAQSSHLRIEQRKYLVRHSLNFCGWKDRKEVAKNLKRIYQDRVPKYSAIWV